MESIQIKTQKYHLKNMYLTILFAKWQPFCLSLMSWSPILSLFLPMTWLSGCVGMTDTKTATPGLLRQVSLSSWCALYQISFHLCVLKSKVLIELWHKIASHFAALLQNGLLYCGIIQIIVQRRQLLFQFSLFFMRFKTKTSGGVETGYRCLKYLTSYRHCQDSSCLILVAFF